MIASAIQYKYGFKEGLDISGDTITKWPYEATKPTKSKLAELKEEYQNFLIIEAKRKEAKQVRNDELSNLTVNIDGDIFQVRPQDEVNFRLVIETLADGETEEWILADNTVKAVNKTKLQQVYSAGLEASKKIYQDYKEVLKSL